MLSAEPRPPVPAAVQLIRDRVNHNRVLTAMLVLAAVANAAVIALFAVGFTHQPLAALYLAGVLAVFVLFGLVRSYGFAGRLRAAGKQDADERAMRVTRRIADKYGLPMPAVVVLEDEGLNALAAGEGANAVVAYTRGLLDRLADGELEAVAAHELGHIAGHDSRLAAVSAGLLNWALTMGALILAAGAIIAGIGSGFAEGTREDDDPTGGLLRLAFMMVIYGLAAMVFVFGLAWSSVAYLFHMALVRQREWQADALSAQVTGRPDLLAAALAKLRDADTELAYGGRFARSLCIAGVPNEGRWWHDLLDSHPSIGRRIARLLGTSAGHGDRGAGLILPVIAGLGATTVACLLAIGILNVGPAPSSSAAGSTPPGTLSAPGATNSGPATQPQAPATTPAIGAPGGRPVSPTATTTSPGHHSHIGSSGGTTSGGKKPGGRASGGTVPAVPSNVTATAVDQYTIQVTWVSGSANATGFNLDNGCPIGSCQPGASLTAATGPVTSKIFTVTPGTYQCFRVQAVNSAGASPWSGYGCTSTPSLTVPGTQEWTDTGVTVNTGDTLGITATGQVYIDPSYPQGPDGDPSCTPMANYSSQSATFPAPNLACWSLVARIGTGPPFEVGSSITVTATSGRLYLGVNDGDFSDNSGNWTVRIKIGGMPPPA
jgi:Zn-dependent protease with chaperone function